MRFAIKIKGKKVVLEASIVNGIDTHIGMALSKKDITRK